jgi:predicted  nucleic acid-binding Zn-ribbon protein
MGNQQQGEFYVALENLRQDLKEHRAETREDIKSLEKKTDAWRDEVRGEFDDVKKRLGVIETQTALREQIKEKNWSHYSGIVALILSAVANVILYFRH